MSSDRAAYVTKENLGDKYNLPVGWLNSDFMKTKSYSPQLIEVSVEFKTFSNILQVRTVSAEYRIAIFG